MQKSLGISRESFTLTLGGRLTIPLAISKNTPVQSKGSMIYDPLLASLFYSDSTQWINITDSTTHTQCIVNEAGDTSVCTDTEPPTDSKVIYFTTDALLRAIFNSDGVLVATAGSIDPTTVTPGAGECANFQGDVSVTGNVFLSIPLSEIYGGTGQNSYATGDTLYASAPNTLSKLPIGSVDQVYTVSGGVPSWQDPQIIQTGPEVPNTQANGDNYEFLPVEIDGNSRYIPLTSTPALNGENDGLNLICMGTDVVGSPSGTACTKLQAAGNPSQVIGKNACQNWNAGTSTSGGMVIYGAGVLQNTAATSTHQDEVVIGYNAANGATTPFTGASSQSVIIGNRTCYNYQNASGSIIIGYNAMVSKPVSIVDSGKVVIGHLTLESAIQTGGRNMVVIGNDAMRTATCTYTENNGSVVIGTSAALSAAGVLSQNNVLLGRSVCGFSTFSGGATGNVVIGGIILNGTGTAIGSGNVILGVGSLTTNSAGVGSSTTIIGSGSFTALASTMASNVTAMGQGHTGTPSANEVMIGRACTAAGVTGRLSFGNAMEAIAATATAGAAALPATPAGFLVIRHNGTVRKLPVYNN